MQIFHQPHGNHAAETAFFEFLVGVFPKAERRRERYAFPDERLNETVSRSFLIECLEADQLLPPVRKAEALDLLRGDLPDELKVTPSPDRISFDFVIVEKETSYFIEFHEPQHRRLSDGRLKLIFDLDDKSYRIPRFLQRLIRDVWRFQHFENFTVVWKDYFALNQQDFQFELSTGKREFALPGQFQFAHLLGGGF